MSDFEVKCRKCGSDIVHHCVYHDEFDDHPDEPLIHLFSFIVPPPDLEAFKKSPYYSADRKDEGLPFFSEAYLYNAFGKEDGRTILYAMRQALRHLGVDVQAVRRIADSIIPCPHCLDRGSIMTPNPAWDPAVYAKKKAAWDNGTRTDSSSLTPFKRNLLNACTHCEAGKRVAKRMAARTK